MTLERTSIYDGQYSASTEQFVKNEAIINVEDTVWKWKSILMVAVNDKGMGRRLMTTAKV